MRILKMDLMKLLFVGLCLSIVQGCSHTGITLLEQGLESVVITDNATLHPQGVIDFSLNSGDVIRIEASGFTAEKKSFLLEKDNVLRISFHYTKGNYRIMAGDEIRLSFLSIPDLERDITVRFDGRISFSKLGEVFAAGKTPRELSKELTEKFTGILNDPTTIVSVLKTNMESLDLISGEYIILPDGNINLPVLGTFAAAGLSPKSLEKNISKAVQEEFHNNFNASVVAANLVSPKIEEYDRVVTITPSGDIILPEIGCVTVRGLTMNEMKNKIQDGLRKRYSNDIDISLTLISGGNHSIYIGGEVRFPGVYPLAPSMTMLKAVMLSGGAIKTGNLKEVVLAHYDENGDLFIYKTNLKEVLEEGKSAQDLKLSPQDIVLIPRKGVVSANIFVEQYITGMLPFTRSVNYNYNENPDLNN